MRKRQAKRLEFPKAFRSFIGYLEGTEKAAHTIKSYKLDLAAFEAFLRERDHGRPIRCEKLSPIDLEHYHTFLKSQGHKTNTRRRKLLTAQRFLRYLSQRNQLLIEIPKKLPAPHKIEKIPFAVSRAELIDRIRALPAETVLDRRNRALLWTLAETGCLVSEVSRLRFADWGERKLSISGKGSGKGSRTLDVSVELARMIDELEQERAQGAKASEWVFPGFNRNGPLGGPISSRGVELLVRLYAAKLGSSKLTPRTFRHSAVIDWLSQGIEQAEVQRRLGLKSAYAFRAYDAALKSSS